MIEVFGDELVDQVTVGAVYLDDVKANGLGIGGGVRYRGMHWGDGDRTLKVPGFFLLDASVHYEWNGVHFGLHARNLLDKQYVGSCYYRGSAGLCSAGEPLTVIGNLSYTW